jgi:hypothetical protein
MTLVRPTDEQKAAARADGQWCVVCHKRYADEERDNLHVYPDECTAHDDCYMSEAGRDTRHWHDKPVLCERCEKRPPTSDHGGWICDECAEEIDP